MRKNMKVIFYMICSIVIVYGGITIGTLWISEFQKMNEVSKSLVWENMTFLGIVLIVWICFKEIREYLSSKKSYELVIGLIFSVLLVVLLVVFLLLTKTVGFKINNLFSKVGLIYIIISFFVQALGEEILFRGYLQKKLIDEKGNVVGVLLCNLMFALLHISNKGITILSLLNIFLLGVLFSWISIKRSNIWIVTGMHMGWNITNQLIFGLPNSGLVYKEAYIIPNISKKTIWIHKEHGVEGGIAVTILVVILIICLWIGERRWNETKENMK